MGASGLAASVESHISYVCSLAEPKIVKQRPLEEAIGHRLASDVCAMLPVPRFSNSAMDGFALHLDDLGGSFPVSLPVAGDIAAGSKRAQVPRGAALRIMTGAPIEPDGDVVVVPVEQTDIPRGAVDLPDVVVINNVDPKRRHIRTKGENIEPGDVVAPAATEVHAGAVAALISTGVHTVDYVSKPNVYVISTGNELGRDKTQLLESQIPDSNGPMLSQLAKTNGAGSVRSLHVPDDVQSVREALTEAARDADIVVTSGGVSAGAFDVIREVAEPAPDMWFGNVAQRPGSPQGAGKLNGKPLVCLPGNPVAAWVSFHLYVAPLLAHASGSLLPVGLAHRPQVEALLNEHLPSAPSGGMAFTPVRVTFAAGSAVASTFNGRGVRSGHVASLAECNGLAMVTGEESRREFPVLFTQQ